MDNIETNQELSSAAVEKILLDCLYKDDEYMESDPPPADAVMADGILNTFAFHPERVAKNKAKISALLAQLEDSFFAHKGGGMSFLAACMTRDGVQWGEHRNMEQLFCLGIAAGLAKCVAPRQLWQALPGGMPYYQISKEVLEPSEMDSGPSETGNGEEQPHAKTDSA